PVSATEWMLSASIEAERVNRKPTNLATAIPALASIAATTARVPCEPATAATLAAAPAGPGAARRADRRRSVGPAGVRVEQVRDGGRDLAGGRQVEELVRPVGVRAGTEHAGDHELGVGEAAAEHPHERDRAALAERAVRPPERRGGCRVERVVQPVRLRRGVPPALG